MKKAKLAAAIAAVTVYVVCPPYRYWVIGSWVGYKIWTDKPRAPRIVRKGSAAYKRLVG